MRIVVGRGARAKFWAGRHRASLSRGPRFVFRSSLLPSAWSCQGSRQEQSSGFSGVGRFSWFAVAGRRGRLCGPLGLRSQRSAARNSECWSQEKRARVVRKLRAARNASDIPFAPLGNPGATADRPASGDKPKIRPRLSALARSCRTNGRAYIHQKAPQDTATNGKALASVQPRPRDRDHASWGQS